MSAYEEGYDDYYAEYEVHQCPYDQGTGQYVEWREGWHAAYDDDDSLYL